MCGSCIAKVTPVLNEVAGENKWKVDIQDPQKTLSVISGNVSETQIINALQRIGYNAELIK